MAWSEQRLDDAPRYTIVPRALVFLTWGKELLFLRGAPDKRLWANKLNGVGGHVEPGETPIECARRETMEETGLDVENLELRAILHIQGRRAERQRQAGVITFVYVGPAPGRDVRPSKEGALEWHPWDSVLRDSSTELVQDLPELLPRILGDRATGSVVYGLYVPGPNGSARFLYDLA